MKFRFAKIVKIPLRLKTECITMNPAAYLEVNIVLLLF